MKKRIFILCGHPDTDSLSGAIASAYEEGAVESGHAIQRLNIGEMRFDPVLHKGYKTIQELEPDLFLFQKNMKWADHAVFVYPSWWNTMPAVLKGLFDRAWLPGFAFNFDKKTRKLIQRLKGKTAHFFIVSGAHSPSETYWCKCGNCQNVVERSLMKLAGIKSIITALGLSENVSDKKRRVWLQSARELGTRGE